MKDQILDTIEDGFFTLDRKWSFNYINRKAANIVGLEPKELIGKAIWEVSPEIIGTNLEKVYRQAMELQVTQRIETKGLITGSWYNIIAFPSAEGISVYWQDISEQKEAENKLAFQAQMLAQVNDAIIARDEHQVITYWNKAAEKISGWAAHEVIGQSAQEVFEKIIENPEWDKISGEILQEEIYTGDLILNCKDGSEKIVNIHSKALKNLHGEFKGTVTSIWDITKQKKVETALVESERKYRELVKHAPAGIYEVDFRSKRFLSVNNAMCQLTGYSREELLEMSPFDILDDQSKLTFQDRISQWLKGEKPGRIVEYKVKAKDGREIYASLDVTFTFDENGKPQGATVVGHDITKRKQMEIELKESRNKYQALIETNVDFIWEMDALGRYTYCSPQMEKLWRLKPEEMIGKSPFDLMPPDMRESTLEEFIKNVNSPSGIRGLETTSYDGQGNLIFIEINGVPFFDAKSHFIK
jgi:PAS domain S-box-containing protein